MVHREQAYLQECVASLLDDPTLDVEVVAIDDAAPGHAPALLDAVGDPRLRVHHARERLGPGRAHDLGLEQATSDHVWFADPTDRLQPGGLARVLERLRSADPDVLLIGYDRIDAAAKRRSHARTAVDALPLEKAAASAPGAFDKIIRRALIEDVRFGAGRHGELPVTWAALLRAERIATLEGSVYLRRRPRSVPEPGSPFDVFDAHAAVLALAGDRRPLVERALARHALRLLRSVPKARRREFFGRIPKAEGVPGSYLALRLRDRRARTQRAIARRRAALGRRRLERYYRSRLRAPIDHDLAVFAAYWYRGYSCNPRAIYEKARELVPSMRGVWVVERKHVNSLPAGVEHVVAGTRAYYDTVARARVLVNNVNFPNHLVKRPGTIHVMTHHGTPLKKMGVDLAESPGKERDFAALLRRCARWDYSVSANPFSTLAWERAYPVPFESLETGYPRNDVLATATPEAVASARAALELPDGAHAVLYAPTHREYQATWVPTLDIGALADALGERFVILARLHYFYGEDPVLRELHRAGRIRDVAAHPSVEQLCLAAEALLTDYSSIMFDYAILDRPIVIHAPDWELYRALRGTYFDLTAEPPGPVCRTEAEVAQALVRPDDPAQRAAFRERFCALEDGGAAERVVRKVWGL